jgi:hypothetical protein
VEGGAGVVGLEHMSQSGRMNWPIHRLL